jgi:hypothetical protein
MLERYVREVASQLPVRMRSDVTLELASLLREDLQAKAEAAGRAPDDQLALEVLQAFGHPRDIAARYHPRSAIIDPNDTRSFLWAVLIGSAVLVALSVPDALLAPGKSRDLGSILVWWFGVVALFFTVKGWLLRRWPRARRWSPDRNDPDRVSRVGMIALIVLIGVGIAAYSEPQRLFAWLAGWHLPSSLDYDPGFRSLRLPWLFAVWIGQAVMLAVLAFRGRWNAPLRRAEMVLAVAVVALLTWFCADGPVMAEHVSDQFAKAFMLMIALILLIEISVKIYRQVGHLSAGKLRSALNG